MLLSYDTTGFLGGHRLDLSLHCPAATTTHTHPIRPIHYRHLCIRPLSGRIKAHGDADPNAAGINTAIYSPSGANSGVGFAIPVDIVRSSVEQIIRFGRVIRPILGISFAPDQSSEQVSVSSRHPASCSLHHATFHPFTLVFTWQHHATHFEQCAMHESRSKAMSSALFLTATRIQQLYFL